jgi:hypothetical protein
MTWVVVALSLVVLVQLWVAYRRYSPGGRAAQVKIAEEMIDEGMRVVVQIAKPRQALHNPLNPTDPERGHPDAQLAIDFFARTSAALPRGYAYDLTAALSLALGEYDRSSNSAVEREQQAAREEGRDPSPVFYWPWPVIVDTALKVLSAAHKDISK